MVPTRNCRYLCNTRVVRQQKPILETIYSIPGYTSIKITIYWNFCRLSGRLLSTRTNCTYAGYETLPTLCLAETIKLADPKLKKDNTHYICIKVLHQLDLQQSRSCDRQKLHEINITCYLMIHIQYHKITPDNDKVKALYNEAKQASSVLEEAKTDEYRELWLAYWWIQALQKWYLNRGTPTDTILTNELYSIMLPKGTNLVQLQDTNTPFWLSSNASE